MKANVSGKIVFILLIATTVNLNAQKPYTDSSHICYSYSLPKKWEGNKKFMRQIATLTSLHFKKPIILEPHTPGKNCCTLKFFINPYYTVEYQKEETVSTIPNKVITALVLYDSSGIIINHFPLLLNYQEPLAQTDLSKKFSDPVFTTEPVYDSAMTRIVRYQQVEQFRYSQPTSAAETNEYRNITNYSAGYLTDLSKQRISEFYIYIKKLN